MSFRCKVCKHYYSYGHRHDEIECWIHFGRPSKFEISFRDHGRAHLVYARLSRSAFNASQRRKALFNLTLDFDEINNF